MAPRTTRKRDRKPSKKASPRGAASALSSATARGAGKAPEKTGSQRYGEGIDDSIAERICELIEDNSRGLDWICSTQGVGISARQFHRWLDLSYPLRQRYLRARELQADRLVDECLEIVDDKTHDTIITESGGERPNAEWISRSKVRADMRMRLAGKLNPKKWGDKLDVTTDGKAITPPAIVLSK